jgi:hypothetical protein
MTTRAIRPSRIGAAGCAAVLTAVSAWAFMSSTASTERDPFQFASIMDANAKAHGAKTVTLYGDRLPQKLPGNVLPGFLAPPPACLTGCS